MPSSKRSVRGLSLAVVPFTAVAALLAALGYASDAPSALLYVAAPAAGLSAGLLALSRWRAGRAEPPLTPGTGDGRGPVPAGRVPGSAVPGSQGSAEPPPMADESDWDEAGGGTYGSGGDVFGAAQPPAAPAPSWAPAPAPAWGPAPAPHWGPTPAPAWGPAHAEAVPMAVAGQPRARLMTVIAELSGFLSLVVSVIALIKDK